MPGDAPSRGTLWVGSLIARRVGYHNPQLTIKTQHQSPPVPTAPPASAPLQPAPHSVPPSSLQPAAHPLRATHPTSSPSTPQPSAPPLPCLIPTAPATASPSQPSPPPESPAVHV